MKRASKGSDRTPPKSLMRIGMAIALSATAFDGEAAGLGRLNVMSSIGQPLRAEIEVTSLAPDEAASLSARLASPATFAQASIDYGTMLNGLRFSIQRRANGNPYVLVTSSQLVNEPFLDVLVELSWGTGRLVREYTLLIDPADVRPGQRPVEPGPLIVQSQVAADTSRPAEPRRAPPPVASAPDPAPARAPAPSPAPTTAIPAPARSAAPSSVVGTGGEYVVRTGDTALTIARDNRPQGVTLEQMLAALYRDNPQAFGGNVNLLLAGARMRIPDAATVQALDGGEARRIVAQSSNFGTYRERIARNAAPATGGAGAQASGRLSTRVEDGSVPANDASDRLQLSRPDAPAKTTPGATVRAGGVGGPSADELAAKDRELQETRNRLALLEKSVADLQQLLALKNQTLVDLQKSATPGSTGTAPTGTASPPASSLPASPPPAPAPAASSVPTPAPAAAVPAARKTTPAPTLVAEESWFDTFKENTLLMVGLPAIVLLLIGYGLFTARRRRTLGSFEDSIFVDNSVLRANSVFGTTGGQSVDTANSGFHSNFVPVAGNLPEQNEVDPVAEADVYIAYGRDAQAEEILKEALRTDSGRHAVRLKLLEIYAKRGDAKTFETMASELYAATGGQGDDWKQAAALGLTIDPHNPLYAEIAAPPAARAPAPAPAPRSSASAIGTGLGVAAAGAGAGFAATGLGDGSRTDVRPEFARTDPMPRPALPPAASAPSMDLDFDLGFANTNVTVAPTTTHHGASAAADARDDDLDFGVGATAKPLIDPFTASAFSSDSALSRTAVNLPAFRARAGHEAPPPARPESDGFSASDIFGTSIVADAESAYSETPREASPAGARQPASNQARTTDFRYVADSPQFEKTEPLDAFSRINLDLDEGADESNDAASDFGTKTDVWQAMATKLDLALAYSDIGDKDGARELLDEVVRNGDSAQADRARQLIGELD